MGRMRPVTDRNTPDEAGAREALHEARPIGRRASCWRVGTKRDRAAVVDQHGPRHSLSAAQDTSADLTPFVKCMHFYFVNRSPWFPFVDVSRWKCISDLPEKQMLASPDSAKH